MITCYSGEECGDIKEYVNRCKENGMVAQTFVGYRPFEMLLKLGAITPGLSSIRLMFNVARGDEHYIIIDETTCERINLKMHAGKPGIHNIEDLLSNTEARYWEASSLNPQVFR